MKPQLLPLSYTNEQSTNYNQGVIYRQYEYQGETYYFYLHPELYPEDKGLGFTGRYLVILLSIRGLENFYLATNESGDYIMDDDESEADRYIESGMEDMFPELEGIHTLPENDEENENDEDSTEPTDDEPMTHWLQFDSEVLMLPLMNMAIKEYEQSI